MNTNDNDEDFQIEGTLVVGEHNNAIHDEPRLVISDTGLFSVNSSALSVFGTDKNSNVAIGGNAENISDTLLVDGNSKFTGNMFIGEDSKDLMVVNSDVSFNNIKIHETYTITINHNVTVNEGVYYIDNVEQDTLTFLVGNTYIFNLNVSGHPFKIEDNNNNQVGSYDNNETGTYIVNVTSLMLPSLTYLCEIHGVGMGGSITVENQVIGKELKLEAGSILNLVEGSIQFSPTQLENIVSTENVAAAGAIMNTQITNIGSGLVITDAERTKLNGIETNADVTDTANVLAAGAVMESTIDVKGDILVGTGDNTITRLPVGTNNYVLSADSSTSTGLIWKEQSGGGGGATDAFKTISVSGQSSVVATSSVDILTLVAGSNMAITTDASTDEITFASSGGGGVTSNGAELLDMKEITTDSQDIILSAGTNYTDYEYFELAIVNVKGTENGYVVWQLCDDSNVEISTNTKSKFEIVSLTDNTPNNITNISENYHILGYNTQAEQNIKAEIYNINKSNKNNFSSFRNVGEHSTSNNTIAQTGNTSSTTNANYTQYKKIIINNYSESGTKGEIQGTFILYGIKKDVILSSATNNFYLGDGSGMKVIEKQKFDSNTKKNEWTFNINNQNDYDYFKLVGINVKCDTAGQLYWKGIKPDNNDNLVHSEFSYLFSNIGSSDTGRGFGENPGTGDGGHLIADNINTSGPINFEVIIYGLNKEEPKYSTFNTSCRNSTNYDQNASYFLTGSTFQYDTSNSADVICNSIKIYNNDTSPNSKFEGTIVLYGFKSNDSMVSKVSMESLVTDTIDVNNTLNVKGDVVIGKDSNDLMVVNSQTNFINDVNIENDLIISNGNVGIGVTIPGVALDISGAIRATGDITAFYSSDKRLKGNIKKLDNSLKKLSKINGYSFDWIPTKDENNKDVHTNQGHDIGVIAQEIEEILPEVCITRENKYKAVKYEKIIPFLIECIKEQQEQINKQQEQINTLL